MQKDHEISHTSLILKRLADSPKPVTFGLRCAGFYPAVEIEREGKPGRTLCCMLQEWASWDAGFRTDPVARVGP